MDGRLRPTSCDSATARQHRAKQLVKGLSKELDFSESYLDKLADDVRKKTSEKQ
jgi:hypothetical protein